nr:hypothetical protein [Paenibacillus xylanexedens]
MGQPRIAAAPWVLPAAAFAGWLARCPAGPPSLGGMEHRAQQKSLHVHAA